jgi:hypothetical protein
MRSRLLFSLCGLALAAAIAVCATGCHESDLEPESPLRGDWSITQWQQSAATMSQADIPHYAVVNPAPLPLERPRSVSLGFIGDAPLTPSPVYAPRWPYAPEPFYQSYAYGYGRYGRSSRGRWR